ncbi:hypothetical protein QU577_26975 [Priestia megaterium]|uniref:hypothetical protein n=1 Tax=Priestia megaterium TaxID=1404 RepID=UPI0025B03ABB|nr:hypothetical protein [Priestia megaterium]MDN3365410.1 hypothetical protein [Priestia megaterium]
MWRITLLSAAVKPVTEDQFTELENGIYERMQDVQDIARNVQSDQISFLNTNITIFLTVAGLILAVVGIVATMVLSRIKKANIKAEQKMHEANDLMAAARELNEQANESILELNRKHEDLDSKLEIMEIRHNELGNILESKELQDKLDALENSAKLTNLLRKQLEAMFDLQYCLEFISVTERILEDEIFINNQSAQQEIESISEKCSKLKAEAEKNQVEVKFMTYDYKGERVDIICSTAQEQLELAESLHQKAKILQLTLHLEAKKAEQNN